MKNDKFTFTPAATELGQRIDKILGQHPTVGSRSKAEFLIDRGEVRLAGKPVKASHRLSAGEVFEVSIPQAEDPGIVPLNLHLEIPYEDDDLIVVNKPAGLVVHPAAGHAADTLVNALVGSLSSFAMKFGENRPGIVHRLDKDTSGLLVIAKNDTAQEALVAQFKARTVERYYQALVIAPALSARGSVQSYLARHPVDRKRYASVRDPQGRVIRDAGVDIPVGKWAKTHYEVTARTPGGLAFLKLKLETGRTHQIRVHLSESGAPIVADPIYGKNRPGGLSKKEAAIVAAIPRLCLHAAVLGFKHPRTGSALCFTVPWPPDLVPAMRELGLNTELR